MVFVYLLIVAAQMVLRRRMEAEAPERLTLKAWLHPVGGYAVGAAMLAVLAAMAATPGLRSQFYASAGCVAVVLGAYAVVRRRRGGRPPRTSRSPRAGP